ncbi:glycosyltransferase family 39 protein [Xylanimonas ulmi]|uniref:Dolichyl-phosphate-mannose-protein mannosyltransferase n=1 Tax=Xylanimonas ulmi TaxID=228973 RepID=A0A4Q7M210_9MICO|nr:glycosyltransferase family 39 protein [Xylanibacterium ulmi]RZS59949.1 dolichyl-phosphate-mannose-protein mannosyltransferase [Xylanibacterium ulmi]
MTTLRGLTHVSERVGAALDRNRAILLFLGLSFALYSAWSFLTPTAYAPDEAMRLTLVHYMMDHGRLPAADDPMIREPNWGFSYAFFPFTPQILGAITGNIASWLTSSPWLILYAIRLPVIVSGVVSGWFLWLTSSQIFSRRGAWFATVLFMTWPQFAFLAGYSNVDTFAVLATTVILYSWVRGLKTSWDLRSNCALAIGLGLLAISYYNAFGWGLLSGALWLWCNAVRRSTRRPGRTWSASAALICACVASMAGWFYLRNMLMFDGDALGLRTAEALRLTYGADIVQVGQRAGSTWWSFTEMVFGDPGWLATSYETFIARFGNMTVFAPAFVVQFYSALLIAACLGLLVRVIVRHGHKSGDTVAAIAPWLFVGILVPLALSVYRSYTSDFQAQGRYLMSALPGLVLLSTHGLVSLRRALPAITSVRPVLICVYGALTLAHAACMYTVFITLFAPAS